MTKDKDNIIINKYNDNIACSSLYIELKEPIPSTKIQEVLKAFRAKQKERISNDHDFKENLYALFTKYDIDTDLQIVLDTVICTILYSHNR